MRIKSGDELMLMTCKNGKPTIIKYSEGDKQGLLNETMLTYPEVQKIFGEFDCQIAVTNLDMITKGQLIRLSEFGSLHYESDKNNEEKALGSIFNFQGCENNNFPKEFIELLVEIKENK